MSNEWLFDTGALIDIYLGRGRIKPYFDQLIQGELLAHASVISEAELWRGLRPGEQDKHQALLARFIVLPLRSETARLAGQWMQHYQGAGLGWMDAFIAATAHLADMPVLTRDKKLATLLKAEAQFHLYD
jgi:predicted nucleic acid-binding protein